MDDALAAGGGIGTVDPIGDDDAEGAPWDDSSPTYESSDGSTDAVKEKLTLPSWPTVRFDSTGFFITLFVPNSDELPKTSDWYATE